MAIVYDYEDIGERYQQFSGPWFPVKDKATLNTDYGPIVSSGRVAERIQAIVDKIKGKDGRMPAMAARSIQDANSLQYKHKQVFDRYRCFAMAWAVFSDYLDPITGLSFDHAALDYELAYLEKQHGITDESDRFRFRLEFTNWIYSQNDDPQWDANPKYKEFIEKVTDSLMLPKLLPMTS